MRKREQELLARIKVQSLFIFIFYQHFALYLKFWGKILGNEEEGKKCLYMNPLRSYERGQNTKENYRVHLI